ncbi:MAG: tol-pal system-associated acyl-CoA thioesterase [Caulobacterales bacterium]
MSALAESPSSGVFDGLEHVLPVRVYYEDTDFTGVVYHANYLRFFERGRTEYLRAAGVDHRALLERADPCAFTVTRLSIEFRRAARVDDALAVRTLYTRFRGVRVEVRQRLVRGEELLAEADVEVVCITPDGRPRRPPPDMLERLRPRLAEAPPAPGAP